MINIFALLPFCYCCMFPRRNQRDSSCVSCPPLPLPGHHDLPETPLSPASRAEIAAPSPAAWAVTCYVTFVSQPGGEASEGKRWGLSTVCGGICLWPRASREQGVGGSDAAAVPFPRSAMGSRGDPLGFIVLQSGCECVCLCWGGGGCFLLCPPYPGKGLPGGAGESGRRSRPRGSPAAGLPLFRVPIKYALPPPACGIRNGAIALA